MSAVLWSKDSCCRPRLQPSLETVKRIRRWPVRLKRAQMLAAPQERSMRSFTLLVKPVLWLVFGLVLSCGGSLSEELRARAALDLACEKSRLEGENLGPRTVRVSGCGRSALFACKQSAPGPEPRDVRLTAQEAHYNYGSGEGPCSWTLVKE